MLVVTNFSTGNWLEEMGSLVLLLHPVSRKKCWQRHTVCFYQVKLFVFMNVFFKKEGNHQQAPCQWQQSPTRNLPLKPHMGPLLPPHPPPSKDGGQEGSDREELQLGYKRWQEEPHDGLYPPLSSTFGGSGVWARLCFAASWGDVRVVNNRVPKDLSRGSVCICVTCLM